MAAIVQRHRQGPTMALSGILIPRRKPPVIAPPEHLAVQSGRLQEWG